VGINCMCDWKCKISELKLFVRYQIMVFNCSLGLPNFYFFVRLIQIFLLTTCHKINISSNYFVCN
jgi:hypothetical protein